MSSAIRRVRRRQRAYYFLALFLPKAIWADQSGSVTLAPDTFLYLDTGAVSHGGGDIYFDGAALTPQGTAGLYNLGKYGSRAFRSIQARQASLVSYGPSPILANALVTGDVFGVRTNSGHYAKVIVSARDNGTLSLQYTVFGATAPVAQAAATPAITQLQNNYSWILPGAGLPNYGIAPGSIFAIQGNGLSTSTPAVLQSSASPGLPTTLNQTSVSVTVKGVTTTPALYYTTAGQIAAVLPSTTPTGTGTISVTYSGQTSAATPIQVVPNAPGLDTLYGAGNGTAVVTDNSGNAFGPTTSATPGQTVILWGSGIGADTANDDRLYPQKQDNLAGTLGVQVFIGGLSATVQYAGRSQYPGLDQYNVVIPVGVTPGCFVSVVAQIGSIVSNAVTMPVSASGGACSDPFTGLNGNQIQSFATKASGGVNALVVGVSPSFNGNSSATAVAAGLSSTYFGKGYEYASQGSCTLVPPEQGAFAATFLDAGAIQVSGPGGQVSLGSGPGFYQGRLSVAPGATYTITGSGGGTVAKFQVSVTVPSTTFSLTNQSALANITRSQGATVTWTGGYPGGTVQVYGSVGAPAVKIFCYAPASAGALTIPSSILLGVPAGSGNLAVGVVSAYQPFTASGADLALGGVAADTKISTTFK